MLPCPLLISLIKWVDFAQRRSNTSQRTQLYRLNPGDGQDRGKNSISYFYYMADWKCKLKRKDLTGNQFGKLRVMKMQYGVEIGTRKRTMCLCSCDCGNTVLVTMDALTSHAKTSCGCDSVERRRIKLRKDLTGMKFGRLSVISMDWSQRPAKAFCECECGNHITVIAAQLSYGKTQSCGCLQAERASMSNTKDWTSITSRYGVRFIKQEKQNKSGQWLWRCECGLCGREFVALPAKVMNGHISSCGCRKKSSREQLIRNELVRFSATFKEQYSFSDCKDKQPLLFDFAVFSEGQLLCLIEYDGKQHYVQIPMFGGKTEFDAACRRDRIKDAYCKENNIRLIRLPYTLSDEEIRSKVRDIIIRRDCNTIISNSNGSAVLPGVG